MPPATPVRERGFGLVFASDRPIPGLAPAHTPAPADVRVHLHSLPEWLGGAATTALHRASVNGSALTVSRIGDGRGLLLDYADGTRFVVDAGGTEVWADWMSGATLEDTATYLLGPVAALLLRLRDLVPLHASAVLSGGGAIAFAGPGGTGKSTLAAVFARMGRTVIADDVVAIDPSGDRLRVHPAYPRLRLWPDSAAALFGSEDALPLLTPNWDKRFLPLEGSEGAFASGPYPLRAVYLLGARTAEMPTIVPLRSRDGLLRLVGATCGTFVPDPDLRALEFRVLSRLAREVPLRAVAPPDDPAALPELCRALEVDAADV